ncbi:hypothetical protein BH012_22925, partial [Salmonella enterica]|nr:hypothetical protein [Salmonella enterica]EDU6365500.1 hypothetical protein [Salmonella enterica subsp. enterica serovar Florian]EAX6604122.1 hypothetical protein [Salmonella enterica]EDF8720374.1 hypothetical protein [Salmonella enterica]EEH2569675.1 hypothetical protein [Salmonella enterica]
MRKTRTENHRKAWTQVELEFVKTYYGTVPTENIAKILGRTFDAVRWVVRNQKRRLMVPYHPWTEEEKEIIRTHFAAGNGIADILPLLPGRTRGAIYLMKDKLDVHSTRQWSQQERQILSQYYPVEGMAVTDRLTGRTRTSVR